MRRKFKIPKYIDLNVFLVLSCILFSRNLVMANDSLKISKKNFQIGLNYGIPVYNKLSLYPTQKYGDFYKVTSKLKSCYEVSLTRKHNHFNYIFSLSYIQSEFEGREFNMGAGTIPYKGVRSPYYYNLYQHIKFNVLYGCIGFGYNFKINSRQLISSNLLLNIPAIYDITISNIYSTNQSNDTTLFETTKNAKNWDTNFGRMPRINLNLSYNYYLTNKIAININLSFLYAYTYDRHIPDDYKYDTVFNHSNNYSYLAYGIHKQVILTPSIGLRFATE